MLPVFLPNEILVKIFEFLSVGDLLVVNLVCRKWKEVASVILQEKSVIVAAEDIGLDIEILKDTPTQYKHWVFKNIDINYRGSFELVWEQCAEDVRSLKLLYVEISERDLISVLQKCSSLESLHLAGFSHMLMPGTFLENENDLAILRNTLKHVTSLQLSCSRYLTDSIFLRFTSVIGSLTNLSLSCCQISYQNAICKRFYPADGRVKASEHVLTFNFVLNFIDKNKKTLTMLDLGSTSLDSESLSKLSKVPDLHLKTLRLVACDQLTKDGIHTLTQYQKQLVDLDIGLCSRITDYAVISIADHLPNLKSLSVRRCHGITEIGMENLVRLKLLEKLDISHLDVHRWESIHAALAKVQRPKMRWLSVASLSIQWETVLALADTMPNLRHLDLSMCVMGVTDRSIQAICRSMVHLEVLLLNGCSAVSDIGLSGHGLGNREGPVPESEGMQLSLESLGIRERDPYKIALGSKAEKLIREEGEVKRYLKKNMSQIISSSEYGLKNLPGLKELNLCGCLRVSDLTLCHAIQFTELKHLNLSHCQQVNDEGVIQVSIHCPSMEEFFLSNCSNITDGAILVLSHRLRRLKALDVQKCIFLTNDALDSLSSCRCLTYLDVSWCIKMTLEKVKVLKRRIPRLLNLHHRGIKSQRNEGKDEDDEVEGFGDIFIGSKKAPTPPPLLSKLVRKLKC